ncbi:hypothetical protein FRC98_10810 [Lujinxingia vulgaris]|uniref:DUF885 domain-containing protein n=1 Tax=Lujinxingia vulgaris TaxID=2600176 RepID=A0A5C6X7E0_9DELT|nr:hypothetical protein [Lujinxingia vulgaris]TXD37214.1 hypothetical protein FRC98_10810 [Lujinxingia vulgaris]
MSRARSQPRTRLAGLLLGMLIALSACERAPAPASAPSAENLHLERDEAVEQAIDLHTHALPDLFGAIAQSDLPAQDPRIAALRNTASMNLDAELQELLHSAVARFDEPHLHGDDDAWLRDFAHRWNVRQAELNLPTRLVHQTREHHGHHSYAPQTFVIEARQRIDINQRPVEVEWRRRLDQGALAGPPTFYASEVGVPAVYTDRALRTVQEHILPMLSDTPNKRHAARREALRAELRLHLTDQLDPLLASLHHREALARTERAVNAAGARCTSPFRLPPTPPRGYAPDTLQRLEARAKTLSAEGCDALTASHLDALKSHSHALQRSPELDRSLAELLRLLLTQQAGLAATHALLAAYYAGDMAPCTYAYCAGLTYEEQAEVAAYLGATSRGELPTTLMVMLCRDHRYGSAEVASAWLRLLRDAELSCDAPWPEDATQRLAELASAHIPVALNVAPHATPTLADLPTPRAR